jgi:hypothetical protein
MGRNAYRRLRDVDSELFDISYVRCGSRLVEQKVEEHAEVSARLLLLLPWRQHLCVGCRTALHNLACVFQLMLCGAKASL